MDVNRKYEILLVGSREDPVKFQLVILLCLSSNFDVHSSYRRCLNSIVVTLKLNYPRLFANHRKWVKGTYLLDLLVYVVWSRLFRMDHSTRHLF